MLLNPGDAWDIRICPQVGSRDKFLTAEWFYAVGKLPPAPAALARDAQRTRMIDGCLENVASTACTTSIWLGVRGTTDLDMEYNYRIILNEIQDSPCALDGTQRATSPHVSAPQRHFASARIAQLITNVRCVFVSASLCLQVFELRDFTFS